MGKQEEQEDIQQQQPDKKKAKIDTNSNNHGSHHGKHNAEQQLEPGDEEGDASSLKLLEQAWEHFVNYLESSMNTQEGCGGDIDELYEILNLFDLLADDDDSSPMMPSVPAMPGDDEMKNNQKTLAVKPIPLNQDIQQVIQQVVTSKTLMLPVLMSVVYYIFADKAIDHFLMDKQQKDTACSISSSQAKTKPPQEQKDCCRANSCCAPPQEQSEQHQAVDEDDDDIDDDEAATKRMIQHFIRKSLHYNPYAASTWSMAANFGRMTHALNSSQICTWYEYAAELAHVTRSTTLAHLDAMESTEEKQNALPTKMTDDTDDANDNELDEASDLKQWIEVLLLNQTGGVEWSGEDDDDDEEEENLEKEEEREKRAIYGKDSWSASLVESTSRFMAAMQLSIAGKHNEALQKHLRKFSLTHRLHPHLWNNSRNSTNSQKKAASNANKHQAAPDSYSSLPVLRFCKKESTAAGSNKKDCGAGGGVLPQPLYQRLCSVFAPDAAYWRESDYSSRGYYSYFMDRRGRKKERTMDDPQDKNNLIRDVVEHHLLPLVEQALVEHATTTSSKQEEIVGYEWWVHTRPIQANLGHNLHFDTDEALLFQEKEVTHPIYSSVLYLTGGAPGTGGGGPTIVLDQTPDAQTVAQRGWRNEPKDNSLFLFPGNLLHGVLPCPGEAITTKSTNGDDNEGAMVPDLNDLWKNDDKEEKQQQKELHRLTFMVGFWTRRVPDGMMEQKLYGPCGQLPPANEKKHSWVVEISKGYEDETEKKASTSPTRATDIEVETVSPVTPVWEEIACYHQNNDDKKEEEKNGEPPLDIPMAIDHRFFVEGAPQCFRDSLFERDEFDDCGENDSEEEQEEEEE